MIEPEPYSEHFSLRYGQRQCIHCGEWRYDLDSDGWCKRCAEPAQDRAEASHREAPRYKTTGQTCPYCHGEGVVMIGRGEWQSCAGCLGTGGEMVRR